MNEDAPRRFGYKMSWLAIKATDPGVVVGALPVSGVHELGWAEALESVHEGPERGRYLFVTPSIAGWVLVVGTRALRPGLEGIKSLEVLSSTFGEAQAFETHRVSGYHHWLLARNGRLERMFAYADGVVLSDFGDATGAEKSLQGFPQTDGEKWWLATTYDEEKWWSPNEQSVMEVAGRWSVNATELGPGTPVRGKCLLGTVLQP